jgi:hypothetical protein
MYRQSILVNIQQSVNNINWKSPAQKQKALNLCASIFNLYSLQGEMYSAYLSLSSNYFFSILPSNRDLSIKDKLITEGILQTDGTYNVLKGISKGYRFNPNFFTESKYSSTTMTFTISTTITSITSFTNSTISYLFPHRDTCFYNTPQGRFLEDFVTANMDKLSFDEDIDLYIEELALIDPNELKIDNQIKQEFIQLPLQKRDYTYSLAKAIEFAHCTGNRLIEFKNKFYIDTPQNFIDQKYLQRKLSYLQSIFNLKNGIYYCNRNTTNYRLDYNLTGLKKDLFAIIKFENEPLVELDIANAQFAIAAYLNPTIDNNFIQNAINGTLYTYISDRLNIEPTDSKELMFRVAFDKVKEEPHFQQIRKLFPLFMQWVDGYKREFGYKAFSINLQRKESEFMIDGLLCHLIDKGYDVFTVHDALRVKASEAKIIQSLTERYFDSINFRCFLRTK